MECQECTNNTPPEYAETPVETLVRTSDTYLPTIEELTAQGINEGIAAALIQALVKTDYTVLNNVIEANITAEIEKRITPKLPQVKQIDDFSNQLKAFESMGYKDRLELSKKNPRLYKELTQKILI